MTDTKFSLDNYVDVAERILGFKERYPEGSLQTLHWSVQEIADSVFIVYQAAAYRTPDDTRPGMGIAWEPFPGTTPYTRNSELMNAETAAWGRACVALGLLASRKIASHQEVKARSGEGSGGTFDPDHGRRASLKDAARGLKWAAIKECYAVAGLTPPAAAAAAFAGLDEEQFQALRNALLNRKIADTTDVPYEAGELLPPPSPALSGDLPWDEADVAQPEGASVARPTEDLAAQIAAEFAGVVERGRGV